MTMPAYISAADKARFGDCLLAEQQLLADELVDSATCSGWDAATPALDAIIDQVLAERSRSGS